MERRYKILVVDDESTIRELVAESLEMESYDAVKASSGSDAVEILKATKEIDIVITDLVMKPLSGIDLLRWARKTGRSTPFILMTGYSDPESVEEAINLGTKHFIRKPFGLDVLLRHVESLKAEIREREAEHHDRATTLKERNALRQKYVDEVARNQVFHMSVLKSLAKAIDARDAYTHSHSQNVAELSVLLGKKAGFDSKSIEDLHTTGLLHDVGKIGVPEAILMKPGSLTDEEFNSIRLHPVTGHGILEGLPDMQDIVEGVLSHHERIDGAGYPAGKRGEAIHLYARVISICDAWDAMTSDRPYRKAMCEDQAKLVLERNAGSQFDPDLLGYAVSSFTLNTTNDRR